MIYTLKQDRRCLECLINEPYKDSIILDQKQFIIYQDQTITTLYTDLDKSNRTKKNGYFIGAICLIFGVLGIIY